MIETQSVLESLLSDLQPTSNLDQLKGIFTKHMTNIGMKHFTYHIVKIAGVGAFLPYFVTTYPDEWVRHYVDQDSSASTP